MAQGVPQHLHSSLGGHRPQGVQHVDRCCNWDVLTFRQGSHNHFMWFVVQESSCSSPPSGTAAMCFECAFAGLPPLAYSVLTPPPCVAALVHSQTMASKGVERIETAEGDAFDPNTQEAMSTMPSPGPDKKPGTVANVWQVGHGVVAWQPIICCACYTCVLSIETQWPAGGSQLGSDHPLLRHCHSRIPEQKAGLGRVLSG